MNQQPLNYYQVNNESDSLRYRLDAADLIEQSIDTFKGGVKSINKGVKEYYDSQRLMNDLGIARARMVIESGVNKINHLTKYKDEERVFRQVKSLVRAWIYEVVRNMKTWAPSATLVNNKLINPSGDKIRSKHLVIGVVENVLLQSMLRGTDGFEAQLTGKQMQVIESRDFTSERREDSGSMRGWFGGRQ